MERDNFNPYKFESSVEKAEDKKEDSKKKAKSASGLGKLLARQETPKEEEKPVEKDERSFLQKLAGESVKLDAEASQEKADDAVESDAEAPLESLSEAEQAEMAQAYIAERAKSLTAEADDAAEHPELAVETDADAAFLAALHDRLNADDEIALDDAIEGAYEDVADELSDSEVNQEAFPDEPQELDPNEAIPLTAARTGRGNGGGTKLPPASSVGGASPEEPPHPTFTTSSSRAVAPTGKYTEADVQTFERRAVGRGLLVGGVIGYLIGRRRGRIKTEKRLKVVQEKLEKQVEEVQAKIEQKEVVIRQLARERVAALVEPAKNVPERAAVVAGAERTASVQPEKAPPTAETTNAAVDSLSKEELLAYSGQIRVGETSLRRVYEAKMVDEKGLRRLIKEYQAGHDLRRALAREFMVKELKFERDPTLRDLLPPEAQPRKQDKTNDGGEQYNGSGVAVTGIGATDQASTNSGVASNVTPGTAKTAKQPAYSRRQTSVSPGVLIGLTLLTIGLAVCAIWLTLSK
jgi:hypothetical protein